MIMPFVQIFPVFDADSPNLARALLLASEELIFLGFGRGMRYQLPHPRAEWELMGRGRLLCVIRARLRNLNTLVRVGVSCMGGFLSYFFFLI